MKFKTKIEIITNAHNRSEAVEIVDDYLSGNIMSGVDMKCRTASLQSYKFPAIAVGLFFMTLGIVLYFTAHSPTTQYRAGYAAGMSAVQPPLRTSICDVRAPVFKQEWQAEQTKQVIDSIKRIR